MNQDWEKFGKDIRSIVEEAINSQDFSQLNQTITNTINDAVGGIQKGIKNAGQAVNDAASEFQKKGSDAASFYTNPQNWRQQKNSRPYEEQKNQSSKGIVKQERKNTQMQLFQKNTSVKAGGLALTICGYTFSVGIGIAVLIICFIALLLGSFYVGFKIALAILVPLLAGSALMAWKGSSMLSSVRRYRSYIAGLQGRTYCNIKELADRNGKSFKFVLKDVKKMIKKGWFREGHLDNDNTCLIVSHDTYQEYQKLQKQKQEQKQLELEKQKAPFAIADHGKNEEVQKVIAEGNEYIRKIRACNDAITGEEISRKISHMEMLIRKIFERVAQEPDSLEDIQKLMEYYLPTTVKLLEAYQQLDSQPVQGENIKSSKKEIEQTLDTLNTAFEKLLDSLFEDVAWDVSSDISVLHTMLAQEGLTKNDFEK